MKNFFLTVISLFVIGSIHAQVGVNTETPATTLHVIPTRTDGSTAEGIIAPNLKRSEVIAKDGRYATPQTGAMIYVSDLSGTLTTKTAKITSTGYYYFDGTLWQPFTNGAVGTVTDANNGLIMSGTTVQLGGALTKATSITGGYNLNLATPLQISSGTPGTGKVLTSDATGNATWAALPAPSVTTANNGLTMSGTTTQLGGPLVQVTTISGTSQLILATPTTVSGALRVSSGTPGAGKVLTSDANGNATWAANATPWYKIGTTVPSILNTDNSYLTAKTVIGGNTIASINGGTANAQLTVIGQDAFINGITVGKGGNNGTDRPTNTVLGANSLEANTTGTNNTAIGSGALKSNQSASSNTAVGSQALQVTTTGSGNNTAIGYSAASSLTTGYRNTSIGALAANSLTTGYGNTTIGYSAANNLSTGYGNTAIGNSAANNLTTGNYSVAIGYNVSLPDPAVNYQMNIGNAIYGVTSLISAAGRVSIGKTTPDTGVFLDVAGLTQITGAGKFKYVDSNQLSGRVLTTDNNGVAKWADQNMLTGSWFYLPSINLDMSSTAQKSINLFTQGVQQLIQTPMVSSTGGGNLPTLPTTASAYEYMVVGNSGHVTISSITSGGIMYYTPTTNNPPSSAYVNIIVRVK